MFEHLIYPKMGLKGNVDLCLSQIGINGNSIPPLELRTCKAGRYLGTNLFTF